MLIDTLISTIVNKFETKEIQLADTADIPHVGIIANGQIIDLEHDYSLLLAILEIYTGETNEYDT